MKRKPHFYTDFPCRSTSVWNLPGNYELFTVLCTVFFHCIWRLLWFLLSSRFRDIFYMICEWVNASLELREKMLLLDSSVLPYFITSWSIGFMAPKFMGTYFYGKAQWHALHAPSSSLCVSSLDSLLCRVWISPVA